MKRKISLLLAILMLVVFPLSGCRRVVGVGSDYIEYESTYYEFNEGTSDSQDATQGDNNNVSGDSKNPTGSNGDTGSNNSSSDNTFNNSSSDNTSDNQSGDIGVTSENEFQKTKITGVPSKLKNPNIKLLSWYDPGSEDTATAFYWAVKKYEELYGEGTVKLTNTGSADTVKSKLAQTNAGGANTAYDLVEVKTQWMPAFVCGTTKQIQPVDGLIDYTKLNYQGLINSTSYDGKHYVGCPNGMWSYMIWYNKTAFEKYGVKTPTEYYNNGEWTWENFQKAAKEMRDNGYTGFTSEIIDMLLRSTKNGLCKYDSNGKIVTNFDDPTVRKALQLMDTMIYTDKSWDPVLTVSKTSFKKGKIAMGCGTINFPSEIANGLKDEVTCVPLPKPTASDEHYSAAYGIFWGIPSASGNVDGAVAFLKILAQYEAVDYGNRTPLERTLTDVELQLTRSQSEVAGTVIHSSVTTFNDYEFWSAMTLNGSGKVESVLESFEPVLRNAISKMYNE